MVSSPDTTDRRKGSSPTSRRCRREVPLSRSEAGNAPRLRYRYTVCISCFCSFGLSLSRFSSAHSFAMRITTCAILPLALAGCARAAAVKATACSDLWDFAPKLLANLEVYAARDYPGAFLHLARDRATSTDGRPHSPSAAGTNFTAEPAAASPAYPQAVPDLPAFCRFGAYIHTSNSSKVRLDPVVPLSLSLSSLTFLPRPLAGPVRALAPDRRCVEWPVLDGRQRR